MPADPLTNFQRELRILINAHSQENESGTPDFILAQYLKRSLDAFNDAVQSREVWYGRRINIIANVPGGGSTDPGDPAPNPPDSGGTNAI
jgi:hypothetical protein